jgi:hypothetical protein
MKTHSMRGHPRWSLRAIIAVASCAFGLGLIVFGFGAGAKAPKKKVSASETPVAQGPQKKPARAWNMALGNVVIVAPELGFGVKAANDSSAEQRKLISRLEAQLQSLRELYRLESEKSPTLMGRMMLQFNVSASGEVSQVKEIASRITDVEFKKAVLGEVSKWSFQDTVSGSLTVTCPLLFVREGMDITTLINWEQSLGQFGDQAPLAKTVTQHSKGAERTKPEIGVKAIAAAEKTAPNSVDKPGATAYQIKYATSVRKEPNFNAASVGKFTVGTKVMLLGSRGDWLEVRGEDVGPSGFIRKEFVTPTELVRKQ